MKEIELTHGKFALVDDDDYKYLSKTKWYAVFDAHCKQYRPHDAKGRLMYRVIMKAPKGLVVDHINHNALDNRKANLRVITNAQNLMNREPNKGRILSKGVYKKGNRYRARIRKTWLGYYPTEKDASRAYEEAAKKLYGEFYNKKDVSEAHETRTD